MRALITLAAPLLALLPVPQEPAPGPAATVTDTDGTAVPITALTLLAEETEAGTLYVTRLPYVPLKTGRGEWRIPLTSITRIDVAPAARPAALPAPARRNARLRVTVPAEGRPVVSTANSSGHGALDAALGMVAGELDYARPTGDGAAAHRPVELEATLLVREVAQPSVRALPVLNLQLRSGETASGRPTGALRLEGARGEGTFQIDLADCRSIKLRR